MGLGSVGECGIPGAKVVRLFLKDRSAPTVDVRADRTVTNRPRERPGNSLKGSVRFQRIEADVFVVNVGFYFATILGLAFRADTRWRRKHAKLL